MTTPATSGGFKPSKYQEGIFKFMRTGDGDAIVNAVAGSGKSTTLEKVAEMSSRDVMMLAFNKHIVESLSAKLTRGATPSSAPRNTHVVIRTIHSVGMGCVTQALGTAKKRVQVKEQKYPAMIRDFMKQYEKEFSSPSDFGMLRKLTSFVRLSLTPAHDIAAVEAMCDRYNIDWEPRFFEAVKQLVWMGDADAENNAVIDFTDMLWLPFKLKLQPPAFGRVLVDECQDLNAAQRNLVLKMREAGGRFLFVGDPYQAIMAFAGADARSYWQIKEDTGATELPLSICYRCPKSHVEMAQALVPQIEASPTAKDGEIHFEDEARLAQLVQDHDLILCRRNAPLIKHCLRLIMQRRPARIRGRDVAKELCDLVLMLGEECKDFRRFPETVAKYMAVQTEKLDARNAAESAYDVLADKCEALMACYEGFNARTAEDLARQIDSLFSDDNATIWLSSIHRAKGLEERRVFVLESATLGTPRPRQSAEEIQQELNLKYVALTRAKETMFLM